MSNDPHSEESFREYLDLLRNSKALRDDFIERMKRPEFFSAYITYLAQDDEQCRQLLGDFCKQAPEPQHEGSLRALLSLGLLNVRNVDFMRLYSTYCRMDYDNTWVAIRALEFGNLTLAEVTDYANTALRHGEVRAVDFDSLTVQTSAAFLARESSERPTAVAGVKLPTSKKDFH